MVRTSFYAGKTFTLMPGLIMRAYVSSFFLQLIGYANLCYASERSEVDPVNRQMVLRTHNVSIFLLTFFREIS